MFIASLRFPTRVQFIVVVRSTNGITPTNKYSSHPPTHLCSPSHTQTAEWGRSREGFWESEGEGGNERARERERAVDYCMSCHRAVTCFSRHWHIVVASTSCFLYAYVTVSHTQCMYIASSFESVLRPNSKPRLWKSVKSQCLESEFKRD